jgi:hypothetical protein
MNHKRGMAYLGIAWLFIGWVLLIVELLIRGSLWGIPCILIPTSIAIYIIGGAD